MKTLSLLLMFALVCGLRAGELDKNRGAKLPSDSVYPFGRNTAQSAPAGKSLGLVQFNGHTYRAARIQTFGEVTVEIVSQFDGKATVPIAVLPPALKEEVGAWIARQRAEASEREKIVQRLTSGELYAQVVVVQRLADGLLCRNGDKMLKIIGHPREKDFVDGDTTTIRAVPAGTFQYNTALGALATVRVYRVTEVR